MRSEPEIIAALFVEVTEATLDAKVALQTAITAWERVEKAELAIVSCKSATQDDIDFAMIGMRRARNAIAVLSDVRELF